MNKIPKGYKQTEVGLIPEEWAFDSIESVTPPNMKNSIVDGPFGSNLKTIHYKKSGIPIITSGYVTDGKFEANEYLFVDFEKFKQEKRSAVNPGDIVMAKIGARCGASAILPELHEIGILSGNALKITVDTKRHSLKYIWQVLLNLYLTGRMEILKTVGAQPAISMKYLKKYKIPLPSFNEQSAIAEALSDVDALISSLDELIAKKRNIKQGAMQELLTGKRRLPGFSKSNKYKQTEVGLIPEDWEINFIEEISEVKSGKRLPLGKSLIEKETAHPYIRILDMFQGGVALNDIKYVPDEVYSCIKNYRIFKDDIFISVAGTLGIVGKIPQILDGANLTENANRLTNIKCDKDYLLYYLMSYLIQNTINSEKTLGAQPKLALTRIRKFQIIIPREKSEQSAIAAVLSDMDAEIEQLESKCDKYKQVKQGMMQELLTGKTRLIKD